MTSHDTFQPGPPPSGLSAPPSFSGQLAPTPPHVAPAGGQAAGDAYAAAAYAPSYLPGQLLGTNRWAIASLVLSLLGVCLGGVIAGHVALRRIAVSGQRGRGLAVTGLVLGYLTLVAAAVVAAWYFGLLAALA
ncbi:DUF4190 domain-containing protein [Isoptericola sp. b441]|uniref:DUF4190 domain-containing protein n=1 Tax=Actinotalea lenta TaxID=3064654 RepID=A0ABT9D9Q1_9CELL|nr:MULTISPECIES: DUF4190 domain-containing protein [unclassified Isoptericola]MDO8105687.1 DUF4190 domain-containing protein [Isoptericola sp. b441]MDO8122392.1 DUF4190 domain-containing protein [Isoptericola sp. b490]